MIHKLSEYYLLVHRQTIRFPKPARFTLGTKLENLALDLIELIMLAKSKSGASQLLILNKADLKIQTLKLITRVAHAAKALPDGSYAANEEKLMELGRILGGWLKQTKRP